jgi:hypothetical protein
VNAVAYWSQYWLLLSMPPLSTPFGNVFTLWLWTWPCHFPWPMKKLASKIDALLSSVSPKCFKKWLHIGTYPLWLSKPGHYPADKIRGAFRVKRRYMVQSPLSPNQQLPNPNHSFKQLSVGIVCCTVIANGYLI